MKLQDAVSGIIIMILLIGLCCEDLLAQSFEFTLNQRRRFDQIEVEIWAKRLVFQEIKIGYASLVVRYNSNYLKPAAKQFLSNTDSILSEIDVANPVVEIISNFNNKFGYSTLVSQNYGVGNYSLEINLQSLGYGGISVDTIGRGSFLGKLTFDIINSPPDTAKTGILWNKGQQTGSIVVFDADSIELTNRINFVNPSDFNIVGITILSPNFSSNVVDRDKDYQSLSAKYFGGGYPIYFERSVNPSLYLAPTGNQKVIDDDLSYVFEYSLDNGNNYIEIGRVSETHKDASQTGNNSRYLVGEIFNPNTSLTQIITSYKGDRLSDTNYRKPLRVIWTKNPYFNDRSEEARLKITILNGKNIQDLSDRNKSNIFDISDQAFVLGRLFFVQLNGQNEYLKTERSFSNSTQLTVTAWINLNSINALGSSPAIVASSLGPEATEINGSKEGAWMLYLKDGRFPAFRVREILGRGKNGYIADLYDVIPINVVSDSRPLIGGHSKNWVHLAATVKNNEVTLYVDGEIVEKYINVDDNDIRMLTTNHPIWIGVNPNGNFTVNDFLRAGIKEVQVWRTALTQDQIRSLIPGVVKPDSVEGYGDLKRGLELYYNFEGGLKDLAKNDIWQNGQNEINFYRANTISDKVYYRPDQPHIKLTAPSKNTGVLNKEGEEFEIRWVSYGLGDIYKLGSKDVVVEYSVDGGNSWQYIKKPDGKNLDEANAEDVEVNRVKWEAWENNNAMANLRSIDPYEHKVLLRIRGVESRFQSSLNYVTDTFSVARYFSLYKSEATVVAIDGEAGMNISGDNFFIEAWIKPYRFPTAEEKYMTIISKMDSVSGQEYYSLMLLSTGQLQFNIRDKLGVVKTALSDINKPLVRPNSVAIDTPWTHIGVYVFLNGGKGSSEIRFYIDGIVQRETAISSQLGENLAVNSINNFPTFIGYRPKGAGVNGFVGEIREIRFWKGTPNNTSAIGNEPTEMTLFVQGALAVRANNLNLNERKNLFASFSFNGRSFIYNGYSRAIGSLTNSGKMIRIYGQPYGYKAVKPYLKLVEPVFKQKVANTKKDLRVRWVGFDYNGKGFLIGGVNIPPSLEFSIRGGGGNIIQPYQFVGSKYWDNRQENSMSFPKTDSFLFDKTGEEIYFATELNVSKADPDKNNDGKFDDQGPIGAALTNARLRIWGTYVINGQIDTLRSEGALFSITPQSNFTVRVLLEGYHDGNIKDNFIRNLGPSYELGGLKIKLYTDNAGSLGELVDSAESTEGYYDRNPDNRNKNNNRFSNVNFVFTDLADGNYWVVVDHINHLPVMSRFAAPFLYEGDEITTWKIESGWDFTSWNGKDENVLKSSSIEPYSGGFYSAYGDSYSTSTIPEYSSTGLVFNDGRAGSKKNAMSAMVGGDVNQDGQINAADRIRVRLDDGTSLIRSDVTGDGYVNADDRTITDRNFGKISSIYSVGIPGLQQLSFKRDYEVKFGEELLKWFNHNVFNKSKFREVSKDDEVLANGISYQVKGEIEIKKDSVLLGMFIKNTGANFGLANATFAVEYNTNCLVYDKLLGQDLVIFSNDSLAGYSYLRSAPIDSAENSLPNVRTIEVDYDAYANLPGKLVPRNWTYLGTLKFKIRPQATAVYFKWHESTSVHTTDSLIITGDGIFIEIPSKLLYVASVETPNGGEKYGAGKLVNIKWNTDFKYDVDVFVEYSTNGGIDWIRVDSVSVNLQSKSKSWMTPKVYSNNYLVRLIDVETGLEVDRSDGKFSIVPNSLSLQRPTKYDKVYRGGSIDSILWTSTGYDKIRFEFSSDGGQSWMSVSGEVVAKFGFYKWSIPRYTTKKGVIRVIDVETGEVITRSDEFKILNGSFAFRSPRKGTLWLSGGVGKISWSSSDVSYFDLQISLNGGLSWTDLQNQILAMKYSFDWQVPQSYSSNNARLRAIWNGDPEMMYAISEDFEIKTLSSVIDNLLAGWEFGEFYPNPCEENVEIFIKGTNVFRISADIFNSVGCKVQTLEISGVEGYNVIKLELDDLPSGKYYVRFSGDEGLSLIRELNVIK